MEKRDITVEDVKGGRVRIRQLLNNEQLENGVIGNIQIKNIHNSAIHISLNLLKSAEYTQLQKALANLLKLIAKVLPGNEEERIELSREIEEQKQLIQKFESDLFRLADTLSRIDLNSERLKKAVAFFEQGKIREAEACIDESDIEKEYHSLELQEKRAKEILSSAREKRKILSDELLVKAQSITLLNDKKDRFSKAIKLFERSISIYEYEINCSAYADFLFRHHKIMEAKEIYGRCLKHVKNKTNEVLYVRVLSKLGVIESDEKNFKDSINHISEAIKIILNNKHKFLIDYSDCISEIIDGIASLTANLRGVSSGVKKIKEKLAEISSVFPDYVRNILTEAKNFDNDPLLVGRIYKSLANFFLHSSDSANSKEYFIKAIQYLEAIQMDNLRLKEETQDLLADSYSNFGQNFFKEDPAKAIEYTNKALAIYQDFAITTPTRYALYIGFCHRLLGYAYKVSGNLNEAIDSYEKAAGIYRKYMQVEPDTFNYHLSEIYQSLSDIYQQKNETERSIDLLLRAGEINQELFDNKPAVNVNNMISVYNGISNLFYKIESAGLKQSEFLMTVLAANIQRDYTFFNIHYALFEISNIYARNNRADLVPSVLEHLENSFNRMGNPNNDSVYIVIQTYEYHGNLLTQTDPEQALLKYSQALKICDKFEKKNEFYSCRASISKNLGSLFADKEDVINAIKSYEYAWTYYMKELPKNLELFDTYSAVSYQLFDLFHNTGNFLKAKDLSVKKKKCIEKYFPQLKKTPQYLAVLLDISISYYNLKEILESLKYAKQCIKLGNEILKTDEFESDFEFVVDVLEKSGFILSQVN